MARLLDSTSMTAAISKIVEVGDELIINGSFYDKSTFSPEVLNFCPIKATQNEILTSKYINLDSAGPILSRTMNNFIVDSNDPNITYVGSCGSYAIAGIYKIVKTNNGNTVSYIPYSTVGASAVMEFISQDSQSIYLSYKRSYLNTSYYNYYFLVIDKPSFTITFNTSLISFFGTNVLKETGSYIYIAGSIFNTNATRIYKLNKTTGAATILFEDPEASVIKNLNQAPSDLDSNNAFYAMKDDGTGKVKYVRYTLDSDKDIVTATNLITDMSIKGISQFINIGDDTVNSYHEIFLHEDNGKQYLNHIVLNTSKTLYITPANCALYTYQIIDTTSIKMVSYQSFAPSWYKVMLPLYNNKLLMLGNMGVTNFYSWNTPNQKFEKSAGLESLVMSIGADLNNNIYIQNQDTSINMLSATLPLNIYVDFEKDNYDFGGNEINTTVAVYTKNYLDQFVTSTLELYLYGPVKFTDTGLKTKIVTSSNLNIMNFPVTVFDSGLLRVGYKIV